MVLTFSASEPGNDEGLKPLEEDSAETYDASESKLTNEEMYSAYRFCQLLPHLEKINRVRKSKVTREVCDRLVTILDPVFQKAEDETS